jgi:hypothetical protein
MREWYLFPQNHSIQNAPAGRGLLAKECHPVQHPTPQRACGRCGDRAVYRVALIGPSDKPSIMPPGRSHYRCPGCRFRDSLAPRGLLAIARDGQQLVVDPSFTAAALAVSS